MNLDLLPLDLNDVMTVAPELPKRALLTRWGDDDWVLELDNTTISQFQTCPRSAEYYCVQRRQRPDRAPLIFGGAIHEALEQHYKGQPESVCIAALRAHFDRHPVLYPDAWRTAAYATLAFQNYLRYWELMDDFEPVSNDWVERPFAINLGSFEINDLLPYSLAQLTDENDACRLPIRNLHVQWTGKIDIGMRNSAGRFGIVDHKTSSIGGDTFFDDFALAQQTHGYCWAASEILGEPVQDFTLNALIIRKPTRTGVGFECVRKHYFYTPESLVDWKADIMSSVETFVHALTTGFFPKHTSWCMGKYGRCQYHDVCTLQNKDRLAVLHSDTYANVTWSPLISD